MADPLTGAMAIVAITNASIGIARSLVHTIKELYELAEAYESAALGIWTVATQCTSYKIAIERINKWLATQNENTKDNLDDDFWQALAANTETGKLVLEDLEKRIAGLRKNPAKFWIRTKYLWNGVIIAELQTQIQGLMSALSILIQVIDLPTTGGKRSQSVAQRKKLNGLTIKNRSRASEHHQRLQEVQHEKLIDLSENERTNQPSDIQQSASQEQTADIVAVQSSVVSDLYAAPPPYKYYGDAKQQPVLDTTTSTADILEVAPGSGRAPEAEPQSTSSTGPAQGKSEEGKDTAIKDKPKLNWKFLKWPKKKEASRPGAGSGSDADNPDNAQVPLHVTLPVAAESPATNQVQGTPMETESPQQVDGYFSVLDTTSSVGPTGTSHQYSGSDKPRRIGETESPGSHIAELAGHGIIRSPEETRPSRNNPYVPMRSESRSRSQTREKGRPDYSGGRAGSGDNYDAVRPSQRVRAAGERSKSRDVLGSGTDATTSSSDPLERQLSGEGRLSNMRLDSTLLGALQNWQTTVMNNQIVKFKVQFEKESFTNKLSVSAARALGVDDAIVEIDGIQMASITLLYTVSDGSSSAANTVLGDEIGLEVMSEHESRTPLLVLGASFAQYAQVAEEGQYIYWNPRAVPEKLRDIDRLRLYRRFELVR